MKAVLTGVVLVVLAVDRLCPAGHGRLAANPYYEYPYTSSTANEGFFRARASLSRIRESITNSRPRPRGTWPRPTRSRSRMPANGCKRISICGNSITRSVRRTAGRGPAFRS